MSMLAEYLHDTHTLDSAIPQPRRSQFNAHAPAIRAVAA